MNFGQLLERVYREIHSDIVDGVATGGSATTIVDTTLITKPYTENRFRDWVAFISTTTDGLTPQSKFGIATAYVKSTGTITIPTVTDAVASGDTYSLCKQDVPLYTLIKLCNDGLKQLGRIWVRDTSLTTAADTLNYTIPIAAKGLRPRSIKLRDSDYVYYDTPNYEIQPAAGGSTTTLIFKSQPAEPYTILYDYMGYHPAMSVYSDTINETLHERLVIASCVERVFHWKAMPKQRKIDMQNWSLAKQMLQEATQMFPVERPLIEQKRVPISIYNA